MDLDHLFENNKSWVIDKLRIDADYFNNLSKNQSPHLLYFGCSDSRVNPERIMGLEEGEVFVHRNISNIVSDSDPNAMSVLYFAINNLKIAHIVVCGHYECGGIEGAMQNSDKGYLSQWLKNINDVKDTHKELIGSIHSEKEKKKKLTELNVLAQCRSIQNSDIVKKVSKKRNIHIYGWVFDIYSGKLMDLNFRIDS